MMQKLRGNAEKSNAIPINEATNRSIAIATVQLMVQPSDLWCYVQANENQIKKAAVEEFSTTNTRWQVMMHQHQREKETKREREREKEKKRERKREKKEKKRDKKREKERTRYK